ncbi:uncharacterized protein ushbp1 [Takifugu rubripes]|uniref:Usher syndrome 1C binding protein 1 n=1 Tax=Takifugu rubripes TaxID=31033 RepID=A0A674MMG2_TAKRU|nr:uncharacterized protein LOC105418777 [Takifugu rubripes]
MEDFRLVRCDSLDAGSRFDREAITAVEQMPFDTEGSDPTGNLGPSPAELAQCEAEMGTLLRIIAELNKKMGSLKPPSEVADLRSPGSPKPLVPDLLSHRVARSIPEINASSAITSKPPLSSRGGGVVWSKLQEVLASVEDSISSKRSWAAPITASDRRKHQQQLKAAEESWTKATQLLEDMEREFGISCPSGLSTDLYQEDILDLETCDSQEELERSQNIGLKEEEKNKVVGYHKAWRSGRRSPSYRSGALSPDWASPPFPGSPLLHRRTSRSEAPVSPGGDSSSLGSGNSCSPPISLDCETERLNRYIERLKSKNERLTAALERRRVESEQISVTVRRLQADCSALQTALRYCLECEETYSELLSLCDAQKQRSTPLHTHSAEADGDMQQHDSSASPLGRMETEEMSTSFSTAGVTEEAERRGRMGHSTPEPLEREATLRQRIELLKRDRAAICLPKPSPGTEAEIGLRTGQQAGARARVADAKKEKASLFYELVAVRDEMSDLRALVRIKEKELRCLEWTLMAHKAQEATGTLVPESLREELQDCKSEQQRLCEKLGSDGDVAGARPILKELQAFLQREQALKKRLALVQDSLNSALSDSNPPRRDNAEQIARLTQAHSKALSSYRQIRRKYREQVWRLEQKVAAMTESQQQKGTANPAEESSEWRREETVL